MSAEEIRRDVQEGLIEAAIATGTGELNATLVKPASRTGPVNRPVFGPSEEFTVTCVITDNEEFGRPSLVPIEGLMLMIAAYGKNSAGAEVLIEITTLDRIQMSGKTYTPHDVNRVSNGGLVLMWEVMTKT
jgi:hypothetical protein